MSLVITKLLGLVTVQDRGRIGRMHEGLPHGGALVPELLARANRAAHNPDDAAALEVLGKITVRAETPIAVAVDEPRVLAPGDEITIESEPRRVAYLAVRGGVDAPVVLGSRSTHLSAGLGAPLRAGDRIIAGDAPPITQPPLAFTDAQTIRVVAGPDTFPADALARLTSAPYKILPSSDRVGTRLDGPALPAALEASRPMVRGAIEVPRDGRPIVLGPEHPTTGGYPVIGVIASADLGRFFAIRIGGVVRFALVAAVACGKPADRPPERAPEVAKSDAAKASLDVLPEVGPHPDYPTPVAAGTDKIFSLEDPDRGPRPPLGYRAPTEGLTWTTHEHCEGFIVGIACSAPIAKPRGLHHWRLGKKPGIVVADRMVGDRVDERQVFAADREVEFDDHGLLTTYYRIANGRYSGRERAGGNALPGCGFIAYELDAAKRVVKTSCLQWLGDPMHDTRGVASVRYVRDAQGFVTETTNLGIDGKPKADRDGVTRYVTARDSAERRTTVRYRDADDAPVANTDGCHGRSYAYAANGALAASTCLDISGQPATSLAGISSTTYDYDAKGCRIRERYAAPDGSAAVDHDGVHGVDAIHDRYCVETSRTCVGRTDQPQACGPGAPARTVWKRDARGYAVSTKYFDANGEPGVDVELAVHEVRASWDAVGNQTAQSCWDAAGTKVECSRTGFHRQEMTYDDAGREISSRYFDTDGKPTTNVGVFEHRYRYDNYDHPFETRFLGEDGELADSMGASIMRELFDASHRHFAKLLYDRDTKPAHYKGCFTDGTCPTGRDWHALRIVRHADGSVVANQFFDAEGQLIETTQCADVPCFR